MNVIGAIVQRLWTLAAHPFRWLSGFWPSRRPKPYLYVRVDEFPQKFARAKVYLVGEDEHLWAAAMLCPCGCGEVIELNLMNQVRPRWSAQEHPDGTLTLAPSVWRQKGCRSHFILREGRVHWC